MKYWIAQRLSYALHLASLKLADWSHAVDRWGAP